MHCSGCILKSCSFIRTDATRNYFNARVTGIREKPHSFIRGFILIIYCSLWLGTAKTTCFNYNTLTTGGTVLCKHIIGRKSKSNRKGRQFQAQYIPQFTTGSMMLNLNTCFKMCLNLIVIIILIQRGSK